MERITWIIIWYAAFCLLNVDNLYSCHSSRLIVVACVVELVRLSWPVQLNFTDLKPNSQGEVIARLVLHAASTKSMKLAASAITQPLSREETLRTLERMMVVQS